MLEKSEANGNGWIREVENSDSRLNKEELEYDPNYLDGIAGIRPENIPNELAQLTRWMCWVETPRPDGGKPGKPPIKVRLPFNGWFPPASPTDPGNWTSLERALIFYRFHIQGKRTGGIHFAITSDTGIVGIDLDNCRDAESGVIADWASRIITRFDSYTEISPSGAGIRIFVKGKLPVDGRKSGRIEVYGNARVLSVTGNVPDGSFLLPVEDRQAELSAWYMETFGESQILPQRKREDTTSPSHLSPAPATILPREGVTLEQFREDNPVAVMILEGRWRGKTPYKSQSSADLALANLAVGYGFDDQMVGQLIRDARAASGDDPEKGEREDYIRRTIEQARRPAPWEKPVNVINVIEHPFNYVDKVNKVDPPTLGEDAYYGLIGEFLREVGPYTEATDAGVLAHLLPAIGVLIGPGPYVYASGKQRCRLNTVLVGPTSTGRKGTSLTPVEELMCIVDRDFWSKRFTSGLSSGEGLISLVADKPKREKGQRDSEDDYQEEEEETDKRLYVVESEFSRLLAQMKRDGNILSQVVRDAFDSGNLANNSIGSRLRASGAHISITGHITPEELADKLTSADQVNGFGNRFLWFMVKSDKIIPRTAPIPYEVYEMFRWFFSAIANLPERLVTLTDEAQDLWEKELYPSLRQDQPGLAGSLSARGSAYLLRMALLYAIVEEPAGSIGVVHLRAALAVWRYSLESVRLLFQGKIGNDIADKVLRLLANGPMAKSEFTDHLRQPGAVITKALALLESQGLVTKDQIKDGPGRPSTMWRLTHQPN